MPEDTAPDPGSDRDTDPAQDAEETARLELPSLSGLFRRRAKSPEAALPEPEAALPEPEAAVPEPETALPEPEAGVPGTDSDEPDPGTTLEPGPAEPDASGELEPEPEPPALVSAFARARAADSAPDHPGTAASPPGTAASPPGQAASPPARAASAPDEQEHEPEWEPARPEDTEPTQVVPLPPVVEDETAAAAEAPADVVPQKSSWMRRLTRRDRAERDASPPETDAGRDASVSRSLSLPQVAPGVAAALTGVVVGLLGVLLTYASTRGCEAVRGVGSCGGAGIVLLVAILGLMVLVGHVLLTAWKISDTLSTSFLGVAIVGVVVMLFLLGQTDQWWMAIVLPLIAAAAYAGSWWGTSRFGSPSG